MLRLKICCSGATMHSPQHFRSLAVSPSTPQALLGDRPFNRSYTSLYSTGWKWNDVSGSFCWTWKSLPLGMSFVSFSPTVTKCLFIMFAISLGSLALFNSDILLCLHFVGHKVFIRRQVFLTSPLQSWIASSIWLRFNERFILLTSLYTSLFRAAVYWLGLLLCTFETWCFSSILLRETVWRMLPRSSGFGDIFQRCRRRTWL